MTEDTGRPETWKHPPMEHEFDAVKKLGLPSYKISETARAARRQQELLDRKKSFYLPPDGEHVCRVANAMSAYRAEHINEPLARLWHRLALVALETE